MVKKAEEREGPVDQESEPAGHGRFRVAMWAAQHLAAVVFDGQGARSEHLTEAEWFAPEEAHQYRVVGRMRSIAAASVRKRSLAAASVRKR